MPPGDHRDEAEINALLDLCRVWIPRGGGYHSPQMAAASDRLLELGEARANASVEDEADRLSRVVLSALHARFVQEMVQGRVDATAETMAMLDALAKVDPDPLVAVTAHVDRGLWANHAGAVEEGLRRTDLAVELLPLLDSEDSGRATIPPGDQSIALTTYINGAWAKALADQTVEANRMLAKARRIGDGLADPFAVGLVACQGILVAQILGDWTLLSELIDWARRIVTGEFVLYDAWLTAGATVAAAVGGDQDALNRMKDAICQLERIGVSVSQTQWHGMLAEAYMKGGRINEALSAVDNGIDWSRRDGERY